MLQYTEKIIDMFVADYTPDMICSELAMCVDNQINSNSIDYHEEVSDDVVEVRGGENIGCEICEFAMSIIDQRLTNPDTVDNVERIVQFMCSYLPGTNIINNINIINIVLIRVSPNLKTTKVLIWTLSKIIFHLLDLQAASLTSVKSLLMSMVR